jgi:hypothetical protein
MRRITMLRSAAIGSAVAAVLAMTAGPARADAVPQLTAFSLSAPAVDVTYGPAQITVLMTVSDPDATGVGSGDVIAHGPVHGYYPSGHLVQVGGTATNTQYRADITLPAGKALDYHMDLSFLPANEFALVDLQDQLVAMGVNYHTIASVTAPPAAPAPSAFTFHRDVAGGLGILVVDWGEPAAGNPEATGATVTSSGCGTTDTITYRSVWFRNPPTRTTTCTVTVNVTNSAGASPPTTVSARL